MGLEDNPWCFRFDGKLWVSELPRETALAQVEAQKAWDSENARVNHWALAIGIGAVVGVIATFALGAFLGAPPVLNLFLLPIGFAVGAVLGGKINERLRKDRPDDANLPPRPQATALVKVPRRVAATAASDSSAREIIRLSTPAKRF